MPQRLKDRGLVTHESYEGATLTDDGHRTAEEPLRSMSWMTYFNAETVGDPDELCLCLLESMAGELDARLALADQVEVLTDAAVRLEPPADDTDPLEATLSVLSRRGLIESYTRSPLSVDLDGGAGAVVVRVSGYALSARDGRLPVLPLTLELCRHHSERLLQSVYVTAVDDDWQLTFVLADVVEQNGLVSAPIDGEM